MRECLLSLATLLASSFPTIVYAAPLDFRIAQSQVAFTPNEKANGLSEVLTGGDSGWYDPRTNGGRMLDV